LWHSIQIGTGAASDLQAGFKFTDEHAVRDLACVYARRFGAKLLHFAPTLVSLRDESGVLAAAGYRGAGAGRLLLETYLHEPIERVLAAHHGVARSGAVRPDAPRAAGGARGPAVRGDLRLPVPGHQ
jgi:hypothetical protein